MTELTGLRAGSRAVPRAWWPFAGVALVVFAAATITRADADLWGHLRFGLDTLHTHRLTSLDPYSFTQDRPWINHEWLSEVQMALAYTIGGTAGLAILKGALAFATLALIWSALTGARPGAKVVVVVLVVLGTIHMTSTLRPQLWTFVSLAILCRALVSANPRVRRWLPVLFALWANSHGGWIVGLAVLGVWAALEAALQPDTVREWTFVVVACALATLANPYGWKLWQFMAHTVRMGRSIDEWQPLWGTPVLNWLPWLVAVTAAVWMARSRAPHRLAITATLAMLAYSSVRVMRVESLFVEAAAILIAPLVIQQWPMPLIQLPPRSTLEPVVAAIIFGLLLIPTGWVASWSLTCVPILGTWPPDAAPARALTAARAGRLVTHFNWGEYAIWHFGPRLRVSMDGRRETVYSDARLAEYDAVLAGSPAGLETLARWRADYVWLPVTSDLTRRWLATHGYREDFASTRSFVAVRADLPVLPVPPAVEGGRRCFPE